MAARICVPQVQCCAVRVTALNLDGSLIAGASTAYVTDSMVKVTRKPVYEAGDSLSEKTACGASETFQSPPTKTRDDLDFDFLTVDPNLLSIMVPNGAVLTAGQAVGFAAPAIGINSGQCGVELWAKRVKNGVVDPDFPYAWHLFPYVNNLQEGDHEYSSSYGHLLLTGEAVENTKWFDGPNNDWPVASNRSHQWIPTTTIPTADCTFDTVAAS